LVRNTVPLHYFLHLRVRKISLQLESPLLLAKYLDIKIMLKETAVAQWLRCCATNWKMAGLIPAGVVGIFH